MNINDFYTKYNLNNDCFSRMAGVGVSTLKKYSKGETIRDDTKKRIELAMLVIEENDLVRPKHNWRYRTHYLGSEEYAKIIKSYEFKFQQLLGLKRV